MDTTIGNSNLNLISFGVWLSLVERVVRDHEVASSNLVTPTTQDHYEPGKLGTVMVLFLFASIIKQGTTIGKEHIESIDSNYFSVPSSLRRRHGLRSKIHTRENADSTTDKIKQEKKGKIPSLYHAMNCQLKCNTINEIVAIPNSKNPEQK